MIEFHVTGEIYRDIVNGLKTCEYREFKHYWINRLIKVKTPFTVAFVKGYGEIKTFAEVKKIRIIKTKEIKNKRDRAFIKTPVCFALEFRIDNKPGLI